MAERSKRIRIKVAYQGAPGAYSEECAASLFPAAELCPQRTFAEVFVSLEERRVDAAVLPVENTHAGAVVDVYDLLRQHEALTIAAESILRVRHCLLGLPGARFEEVRVARSHPQALAQCEPWLRERGIESQVAFDTAGAAAEVAALRDSSVAAIASRRAGKALGLAVLAEGIEAMPDNYTRFFALRRREYFGPLAAIAPEQLAGSPKTSIVFAVRDVPGALVRALQPFAAAGVNLAKIESRPSRVTPFDYVFYLDFQGDADVSPAKEAMEILRRACTWVQVLGTYPMAARPNGGGK